MALTDGYIIKVDDAPVTGNQQMADAGAIVTEVGTPGSDTAFPTEQAVREAVGAGTDEKVKVSADDTTSDYLLNKLAAGTNISLTETNPGADEDVTVAVTGLVIGTNVQAHDADLTALAGLTSAANKIPYFTGSETADMLDFKDEDDMVSDSATALSSQQSIKAYVDAAGGGDFAVCNGRLSLSTNPLPYFDVTAAVNLYFTQYIGNKLGLYNGVTWDIHDITAVVTLWLGSHIANKNYDIFIYDNSGTLTLDSVVWTNDTTRATSLYHIDGIHVKNGATNYLYLGTIRINSAGGQCEDTATERYVANFYNQVPRRMFTTPGYLDNNVATTASVAATTNFTPVNGGTGAYLKYVSVGDKSLSLNLGAFVISPANGNVFVGIGDNSTTTAYGAGFIGSGTLGPLLVPVSFVKADGYYFASILVANNSPDTAGTISYDTARVGSASDPRTLMMAGSIMA